jgi:lysozyme
MSQIAGRRIKLGQMTITSRLSRALKLVKAFEAFHAHATPQDGGFVIGYGHTASAREGALVTRAEAEELLIYDLGQIAVLLDAWVYAPLHDNQRQALIAFGFNIGAQNLHRSTALRRLNAGDYMGCAREIERWRMAELAGRGQVVDALVRRRAAEKALFLTPFDGFLRTDSTSLRPRFDGDRKAPAPAPEPPIEPASAAMTAAHNVSARLRALLPDPEPEQTIALAQADAVEQPATAGPDDEAHQPELERSPVMEATSTDFAAPQRVPDRDAEADAALLNSIVLDPIPLEPAPPHTAPSEAAPVAAAGAEVWPLDEMAPPPPPPFIPAARPRAPTLVSANDPYSFDDGEAARSAARSNAEPPVQTPEGEPVSAPTRTVQARLAPMLALARQRGHLVLGLIGVLLFVISILLILTGKPSAANLLVGLVGVLCMTPTAYTLLGPRAG